MTKPDKNPEPENSGPEHHGPDKFQNVVRWFIMLFLAYVFIHNLLQMRSENKLPIPPAAAPVQSTPQKASVDCNKKFPMFDISLMPLYVPSLKITDVKAGAGEVAACSQKATFHYKYSVQDKIMETGEKTAVIGDGTLLHGTELGLIGMQPGSVRSLDMPPQLAQPLSSRIIVPDTLRNQFVTAHLTLEKLSPALPVSKLPLRAIDITIGSDREVECGDMVSAIITLWKPDGSLISSTPEPVSFIIGESQIPYGIEQGAIGMRENGSRLVVIPPGNFDRPLIKTTSPDNVNLSIPDSEIVLAEIDQLHIENRQYTELPASFKAKPAANKKPESKSEPKKEPKQ